MSWLVKGWLFLWRWAGHYSTAVFILGPTVTAALWAAGAYFFRLPPPIIFLGALVAAATILLLLLIGKEWNRSQGRMIAARALDASVPPIKSTPDTRSIYVIEAEEKAHTATKRDTWITEAIFYAVHGRWLGADEQALNRDGDTDRALDVVKEMRQKAADGEFRIWGRASSSHAYQAVPSEFWITHSIDFIRIFANNPHGVKTEPAAFNATQETFSALMVSKAEVEKAWPPQSLSRALGPATPRPLTDYEIGKKLPIIDRALAG